MKKAGYRFPEKVAVASEGNPTALYEKSWLRFLKKVAVASERQAGSFLEQDSTEVPKSAILRFCPSRETCWGVPSPNPALRLAPLIPAAPKNSPPDCFLNGCFDYIPQQKYKSTTRVLLIFGGDEDDKSETVLSSDNVRLLALSLKLK